MRDRVGSHDLHPIAGRGKVPSVDRHAARLSQSTPLRARIAAFAAAAALTAGADARADDGESPCRGRPWAAVAAEGVFRVAAPYDGVHVTFVNGFLEGFDAEWAHAFGQNRSLRVEVVPVTDRADGVKRLCAGDVDAVGGDWVRADAVRPADDDLPAVALSEPLRHTALVVLSSPEGEPWSPQARRRLVIPGDGAVADALRPLLRDRIVTNPTAETGADVDTAAAVEKLLAADGYDHVAAFADEAALVAAARRRADDEGPSPLTAEVPLVADVPLAWAFAPAGDTAGVFNRWVQAARRTRKAESIYKRSFGEPATIAARRAGARTPHTTRSLTAFDADFRAVARAAGVDWRLLAAMARQESSFNPKARGSGPSVGIMQVHVETARGMRRSCYDSPRSNIACGTSLLVELMARYARARPGDREAMALAGYNAGGGRVRDAQELVERLGGDPHSWSDVRRGLLLLAEPRHYRRAKYGRLDGAHVVRYVESILAYHRVLVAAFPEDGGPIEPDREPPPETAGLL